VAKQFRDLKFGDRFYFENDLADTKFSLEQLQSIRSVTVSRLLCDNLDIDFVQKYAFFVANKDWNPLTLCKDIPELNLNLWAISN
jgi:peroxidase